MNESKKVVVKYKHFKFDVFSDYVKESSQWVIVSLDSANAEVNEFNNEVFFGEFVGAEFNGEYEEKMMRRIKRAFAKFINEPREREGEYTQYEETVEVVDSEPKNEGPGGAIDRIIFDTVKRALSSPQSKEGIDVLIKELIIENGVVPFRKILQVKKGDEAPKDTGLQHFEFERIYKTLSAGVPIALVGPAGSGKTTLVYNVAKSLDMPFSSESVSAQSTKFDFFGYKTATGEYQATLFRDAYENGGVYLLDEFDAGNPNVLAALNQATGNSIAPFPDKMVEKHKDFIIVMAGNTFGGGGTIDYVGRNKIDAATLDRFVFVYVAYDEEMERNLATNQEWCRRVQEYRAQVEYKKVRAIVSPRATFNGEKLLAAGIPQEQVEEMVIFKGMNADERNLVTL